MNMIYREKGKALTTEMLLEEMHLQFRLSGGKSQKGDKDSDEEEEVALTAAGKKGGKSEGKKKGDNPNANKKCNHCEKKGHVEADCWKKFPDKIPDKVKLARKKAEEKKAVAAAAVEDEVIIGTINEDLIPSIAVKFETENEYKVLFYLTEGWLNKQIAYDMNVQETTIKQHVSAILRKLGVHNRVQAILSAGDIDFASYLRR